LINWPAIIKHADDAELVYVADQSAWDNDADLHSFEYDESDYLIDASGNTFSLTTRVNQFIMPEPRNQAIALLDILGLVKAHAAQQGSCCVAKLYAPTIAEAFNIVASLQES